MNEKKLFHALNQIDDDLIEQAAEPTPKKKRSPMRFIAMAACACLFCAFTIPIALHRLEASRSVNNASASFNQTAKGKQEEALLQESADSLQDTPAAVVPRSYEIPGPVEIAPISDAPLPVTLGMTGDTVTHLLGDPLHISTPFASDAVEYHYPSLVVVLHDDRVSSIQIQKGCTYLLPGGVVMGSSFEEVSKAYALTASNPDSTLPNTKLSLYTAEIDGLTCQLTFQSNILSSAIITSLSTPND